MKYTNSFTRPAPPTVAQYAPDNIVSLYPHGDKLEQLVQVKADIEALKVREEAIRKALIDTGLTRIDSSHHYIHIVRQAGKKTTDWHHIAKALGATYQMIAAHTSTGDPFYKLSVFAHEGINK